LPTPARDSWFHFVCHSLPSKSVEDVLISNVL
jgi:hypothetical protein